MSSTSFPTFRRARAEDIPAMSAIRLSVKENVLSNPARVTSAMYEDYLEAGGRGWVAELDGEVAAFSYADHVEGSIWALFVAPHHEGRGMARPLLALAADYLFERGHDSVRLSTGAHTRADRFYAAQGWTRGVQLDHEVEYTLSRSQRQP